ncbi:type II toxin-antitoxin system RelE/ParE family toxin [Mesorhizobium sp. ASY16-5R]|uniref:type II toxin-antitoxin system RelE/ParE family toxin n=1 Tax=Mesorhizobium sp. ASY16-5R TaxID=3445772 RepID=UPI003FA186AB
MTVRFRPEAEADIEAIVLYIAEDNPSAATHWVHEIHAKCETLGKMPGMGVARSEIRQGLRTFPAGNYLIFHQLVDAGVEIVRVVHGAR